MEKRLQFSTIGGPMMTGFYCVVIDEDGIRHEMHPNQILEIPMPEGGVTMLRIEEIPHA